MDTNTFKAKDASGAWVFGYFRKYPCGRSVIYSTKTNQEHIVQEKTLCRCLGEHDINGKILYENDMINDFGGGVYIEDKNGNFICQGDNTRIGIIVFEDGTTRVRTTDMSYSYNISNASKLSDMEYISNVFE